MMPMMRFFRHGDGSFAHFNGMGPTHPDVMATILAYDDARGAPLSNAPHSGYQRVEAGDMLLLMDTGGPPPIGSARRRTPAACRSNCRTGCSASWSTAGCRQQPRRLAAGRARHRRAFDRRTFNDSSSCRFLESGSFKRLLGTPIVGGPVNIQVSRDDREDATVLRASHDGYADRYSVIHQRALKLAATAISHRRRGPVRAVRRRHASAKRADEFAVRFHLHPAIKANKLTDGHGAMLMLPSRDVWTFNAYEDRVELEETRAALGLRQDRPRRFRPRARRARRRARLHRRHREGARRRRPRRDPTSPTSPASPR
jgi:uncharacterized heparinase superfamily protein